MIFAGCSPFVRDLISRTVEGCTCDAVTLHLPDFHPDAVRNLLSILYTGLMRNSPLTGSVYNISWPLLHQPKHDFMLVLGLIGGCNNSSSSVVFFATHYYYCAILLLLCVPTSTLVSTHNTQVKQVECTGRSNLPTFATTRDEQLCEFIAHCSSAAKASFQWFRMKECNAAALCMQEVGSRYY